MCLFLSTHSLLYHFSFFTAEPCDSFLGVHPLQVTMYKFSHSKKQVLNSRGYPSIQLNLTPSTWRECWFPQDSVSLSSVFLFKTDKAPRQAPCYLSQLVMYEYYYDLPSQTLDDKYNPNLRASDPLTVNQSEWTPYPVHYLLKQLTEPESLFTH